MKKLILSVAIAALVGMQVQAVVTKTGTHGTSASMGVSGIIPIAILGPEVSSSEAFKNLVVPKTDNDKANKALDTIHQQLSLLVDQNFKDLKPADIQKFETIIGTIINESKTLSLVDNKDTIQSIIPYFSHLLSVVDKKKSELLPLSQPLTPLQPAAAVKLQPVTSKIRDDISVGFLGLQHVTDAIKNVIAKITTTIGTSDIAGIKGWKPQWGVGPVMPTHGGRVTTQSLVGGKKGEMDYCKAMCAHHDNCASCMDECYKKSGLSSMPGYDQVCYTAKEVKQQADLGADHYQKMLAGAKAYCKNQGKTSGTECSACIREQLSKVGINNPPPGFDAECITPVKTQTMLGSDPRTWSPTKK